MTMPWPSRVQGDRAVITSMRIRSYPGVFQPFGGFADWVPVEGSCVRRGLFATPHMRPPAVPYDEYHERYGQA